MDTLTILFVGLIAHVMTDGGAQRAVLVAAPQHEARLIVDVADVIENRGFERDARGAFRLEGERIIIDDSARRCVVRGVVPAQRAVADAHLRRNAAPS